MAVALLPGNLDANRANALGQRTAQDVARRIAEAHRKALQSRRRRDLVGEKVLLHIDGSGDNQWADIFNDQRVAIPRDLPEPRLTKNLLQPIVKNQIAYHTTMPLQFIAEHKQSREAREKAVLDGALANYVARRQRVNQLLAQAMLWADCFGFCPVHSYWRDDLGYDPYEPLYLTSDQVGGLTMPRKGMIDVWVGNPGDTTFNEGAKRGSFSVMRYGRPVPAQMVRDRFGVEIEGSTKLSSASAFQRIARRWGDLTGLNLHGGPTLGGNQDGEELVALICQETAPGVDPDFPEGRLTIVALPGQAETTGSGRKSGDHAVVLADQALPAGRFSGVVLYSDPTRADDVHGGPWAEPLSELQVQYNIARSDRRALIEKSKNAPIVSSGMLSDESRRFDGWTVLESDAGMGGVSARVMEAISQGAVSLLTAEMEDIEEGLYTIGGYQAASRGESDAGDPYAKVALLQQQDDTIHGPTNIAYRNTCEDMAQLWWALFKEYGDVPWVIDSVGEEFDMLPEDFLDNTMVSEEPPAYRVVSGYGATPEIMGRQLMAMVQMKGADGEPVLRTSEFRKKYPDGSLFNNASDPNEAKRRRARHIANRLRRLAREYRQTTGLQENAIAHPWVQQAGQQVFLQAEQLYPRLRSDDLQANIDALAEIEQDETEDAVARVAATMRLEQFYAWQMAMATMGAPMMEGPGQPQGQGPSRPSFEYDPAEASVGQTGAAALDADPMGGAIPAA